MLDTCLGKDLSGLGDERDEVVAAVGEGRVVQRPRLLGYPHRLAAHLHDEGLGDGAQRLGRGDPEARLVQPGEVERGAREGHRGVQRQRDDTLVDGWGEGGEPVRPGGVGRDLPGAPHLGRGEAGDEIGQGVVRHGEQHEVSGGDDLLDRVDGDVRQEGRGPLEAGLAHGTHGDDTVPGCGEGGAEHGPDPSGSDDADAQPGARMVHRVAHGADAIADLG